MWAVRPQGGERAWWGKTSRPNRPQEMLLKGGEGRAYSGPLSTPPFVFSLSDFTEPTSIPGRTHETKVLDPY